MILKMAMMMMILVKKKKMIMIQKFLMVKKIMTILARRADQGQDSEQWNWKDES